jgi:hypothetical protein
MAEGRSHAGCSSAFLRCGNGAGVVDQALVQVALKHAVQGDDAPEQRGHPAQVGEPDPGPP